LKAGSPRRLAYGDELALAGDEREGPACALRLAREAGGAAPARASREEEQAPAEGLARWAEEHLTCAICQELIVRAHGSEQCRHVFCGECIQRWASMKGTCPECRAPLGVPTAMPALDALADEACAARAGSEDALHREERKTKWERVGLLKDRSRRAFAKRVQDLPEGNPGSAWERQAFARMTAQYRNYPLKVRGCKNSRRVPVSEETHCLCRCSSIAGRLS
jgi:hypothetical protein